ncbi:MAG TPA: bifunctional demethylmenaquinone methyltransferase/2-methoxy-6-polyprenyl-1,4-benzoquinol methylase UbiE [Phycisphaerales bacterium]|nr:bifunctional demethylmenaquinone methyltransferase/2-methoxy-6-polyprenyl-1,4-benzoquinol methylase UbiE [Phycisphaerales bacterium]
MSATTPSWTDSDLRSNPHAAPDKASRVRSMFAAIARSYDLNNRLHSLGTDVRWRRKAVELADVNAGDRVLDVACGTGDLTQEFARTAAADVVGLDFTREMLDIAGQKRTRLAEELKRKVSYVEGDAQRLPFADATFHVVSIAFGIRNILEPDVALREFARVLRPGGRLIVLEFDRPTNPLVRGLNHLYCARVMPLTATLLSGDKSGAYKYLPRSVETFLSRDVFIAKMNAAGFQSAVTWPLTMGIAVIYRTVKSQ